MHFFAIRVDTPLPFKGVVRRYSSDLPRLSHLSQIILQLNESFHILGSIPIRQPNTIYPTSLRDLFQILSFPCVSLFFHRVISYLALQAQVVSSQRSILSINFPMCREAFRESILSSFSRYRAFCVTVRFTLLLHTSMYKRVHPFYLLTL